MFYVQIPFEYYSLCKKLYLRNVGNFKVSVRFQDFTNFRSSQGFSCHFSKTQRFEHSFTCSLTFSFALLECPHFHNLHWKARFLWYSAFPFLLRIPKWSTGSTSTTQNPTVDGIYLCIDIFLQDLRKLGQFQSDYWTACSLLAYHENRIGGAVRILEGFLDWFWFHKLNGIFYNAQKLVESHDWTGFIFFFRNHFPSCSQLVSQWPYRESEKGNPILILPGVCMFFSILEFEGGKD